jgi:hypothetical protein
MLAIMHALAKFRQYLVTPIIHSGFGLAFAIYLEHSVWGFCCTNPCEQLSGEISTHLVPQLGLEDGRLLHTILVSTYLHLALQKIASRTVLVIPARAHHHLEGGLIQFILMAWGHFDTWVLFAGA